MRVLREGQCAALSKAQVIKHWVDVYASNSSLAEFKEMLDGICDKVSPPRCHGCPAGQVQRRALQARGGRLLHPRLHLPQGRGGLPDHFIILNTLRSTPTCCVALWACVQTPLTWPPVSRYSCTTSPHPPPPTADCPGGRLLPAHRRLLHLRHLPVRRAGTVCCHEGPV